MIGVIFGEKGTGKTKQILEMANKSVLTAKGNTIFIDNDTSYIYDLSRKARFINATEYGITSPKMLYGFLCGLAASDFDLETVYIDGLLNIIVGLNAEAKGAVALAQQAGQATAGFLGKPSVGLRGRDGLGESCGYGRHGNTCNRSTCSCSSAN